MSFGVTHANKKANKRRGRVVIKDSDIDVEKGEGFYGTVIKLLGDNRLQVNLNNGTEAQATFSGKFRKKIWIKIGNIVLLNDAFEVQQIINDVNKRSVEAHTMMRKAASLEDYYAREEVDDDDEEYEEDIKEVIEEVKKVSKQEKTKDKRNGGVKVYTDFQLPEIEDNTIVNIDDI